jgi:hypothetical protein
MAETWSPHELERIDAAGELSIAVERSDGTLHRWTPIWVVCADEQVYVRTWYRRDTGWFGHALRSHRARIRVPGLEADAAVKYVGAGTAGLRESIDTAYRNKYGSPGSSSMVSATAAATTLRLSPDSKTQLAP